MNIAPHAHWLVPLLSVALGVAVALAGWVLASTVAAIPDEDRTYRDAPPLLLRLVWWPMHWLAYALGRVLPIGYRQRVLHRLRAAGLDYLLSSEQFVALRVIGAGVAAGLAAFLASGFALQMPAWGWLLAAGGGFVFPAIWLRDRIQLRRQQVLKTLPFALDMITLCVEAGLNLNGAIEQTVRKGGDGPLQQELRRVLRDVRAGKPRADALRTLADRMGEPAITSLVSALIQAEATGMNLGPVLRAQSEQRRQERFARAEKAAMEAPVKMLFPLIVFIFPCTFVVLGFPIAMKIMQMGW